ncbi:MAG: carbon-nitrogen hydrolase family protein [Chloroflexi bacterium]|nr:carbon-nitrogen hydrolase family protein [Chloroflexota bacterium]
MRVALAQMEPHLFEKKRNLDRASELLDVAAHRGAKLVVFPECAITGYVFASRDEALPLAEPVPGPSTDALAQVCAKLEVHTVVGLLETDGEHLYNAAALIGPQGLIGAYRKVHLPYLGVDRFADGGAGPFPVYETPLGKIGLLICYDATFPEAARALALGGAEIIALPTNWPSGREKVPAFVVNSRALENRVHFLACNRTGKERGFTFIGQSKIADATGETRAYADNFEEIVYADLDLEQARNKTLVFVPGQFELHTFEDRRPELYGALTHPVQEPVPSAR